MPSPTKEEMAQRAGTSEEGKRSHDFSRSAEGGAAPSSRKPTTYKRRQQRWIPHNFNDDTT